jgi:pimeloyl-ACP methyl ester carboxylesterase
MHEVKKRTGTFQSFDGTSIYYEVRGEGAPIVFCYGIACVINHWIHQIRYFSQNYQTIVFDYRGHHASDRPANMNNVSIDAVCKDINALLKHLEIERASFWGHSFGVPVLLRYYQMYRESVHSMVFINGFATNPIKGMFGVDFMPRVFSAFKDGHNSYPELVRGFWRAVVANPLARPVSTLLGGFGWGLTRVKDIEVYARGVSQIDLDVFISLFQDMMSFDGRPILSTIDVPTLIVSGSKDGVTPASKQREMQREIRGSQLLSVPYGSHCTQLDVPEFVNLRCEKFLEESGIKSLRIKVPERADTPKENISKKTATPSAAGPRPAAKKRSISSGDPKSLKPVN